MSSVRFCISVGVGALLWGAPLTGQTVHLDFDDLPGMENQAGAFVPGPSRFVSTAVEDWRIVLGSTIPFVAVVDMSTLGWYGGENAILGADTTSLLNYTQPIRGRFVSSANAATRMIVDRVGVRPIQMSSSGAPSAVTLKVFDVDGREIASLRRADRSLEPMTISAPGIASFQVQATGSVAFDDVTFGRPACLVLTTTPQDSLMCPGGTQRFEARALGQGPIAYRWFRNGVEIPDKNDPVLSLSAVDDDDVATYSCIISNACGTISTTPVTLTLCPMDFNCDGLPSLQDYMDFLDAFFAGDVGADYTHDGTLDSEDLFEFLNAYITGCGGQD